MSDTGSAAAGATTAAPKFTDREMQMLGWAMQSLKTPPEVDYDKLAAFAGMTNPRSASNAWANIKKKLFVGAPADGTATSPKPKATPKKKAPAAITNGDAAGDSVDETPKKTPRKRAAPKKAVGETEEGSPKKRGRKPKKEEPVGEDESKANSIKKEIISSAKAVANPELKADDEDEDVLV